MTPFGKALKFVVYIIGGFGILAIMNLTVKPFEEVLLGYIAFCVGMFIIFLPLLWLFFYTKEKVSTPSFGQVKDTLSNSYTTFTQKSKCECPKCSKLTNCSDKFCPNCGAMMRVQAYSQTNTKIPCVKCGGEHEKDTRFCIHCGNTMSESSEEKTPQQSSSKKSCKKCDYQNDEDTKFCIKCGTNL